jgi:PAS domain S-box-containing protein
VNSRANNLWPLVQCVVLAGGVFAFDNLVQIGVAGAVAYVAVILASVSLTDGRYTFPLAVLCAGLTLLRMLLPAGDASYDFWEVLTNRLLAVFAIFVTAALGIEWKRSKEALQRAHDGLEQRVAERTAELSNLNRDLLAQIERRERAEQTGRELEDRTAIIVEHAVDAIIVFDSDGIVVTWNPRAEEMFGRSQQDVLGEPLVDLIVPEGQRSAFGQTPDASLLNRRTRFAALHQDGHEVPVELYVTSVPWGNKHLFIAFLRELEPDRASVG